MEHTDVCRLTRGSGRKILKNRPVRMTFHSIKQSCKFLYSRGAELH